MTQSPLASDWKLQHFDDGAGESAGAHLVGHDDSAWLPATAPGQVHLDLMAAGVIPDPFFGLNYEQCLWVEEQEWWYRSTFVPRRDELPGKRIELVFEGLDTFATVYLNGEEIGTSRNMWVPAVFDVTDPLKWGEPNTLAVRLRSPFEAVKPDTAADDIAEQVKNGTPRDAAKWLSITTMMVAGAKGGPKAAVAERMFELYARAAVDCGMATAVMHELATEAQKAEHGNEAPGFQAAGDALAFFGTMLLTSGP